MVAVPNVIVEEINIILKTEIPREILETIFSYLCHNNYYEIKDILLMGRDILRATLVCKLWMRVIRESVRIYRASPFHSYAHAIEILMKFHAVWLLIPSLEIQNSALIDNIGMNRRVFYYNNPYIAQYHDTYISIINTERKTQSQWDLSKYTEIEDLGEIQLVLRVSDKFLVYFPSLTKCKLCVFNINQRKIETLTLPCDPIPLVVILDEVIIIRYPSTLYVLLEKILVIYKEHHPLKMTSST